MEYADLEGKELWGVSLTSLMNCILRNYFRLVILKDTTRREVYLECVLESSL